MKITHTESDGTVTVSLAGMLTGVKNSNDFFQYMSDILAKSPDHLNVDLSNAVFMDSMFIGCLVGVYLRRRERNQPFQLVNPSSSIQEIINSTGLHQIIQILDLSQSGKLAAASAEDTVCL